MVVENVFPCEEKNSKVAAGYWRRIPSGSFTFDASLPPNSRIVGDIKVGGHIALPDATFKVVMKEYMSKGKDGYNVLADCKVLVDSEHAPVLATTVRNAFTELSIVNLLAESKMVKSVVRGSVEMRRTAFLPVPEHVSATLDSGSEHPPVAHALSPHDADCRQDGSAGSIMTNLSAADGLPHGDHFSDDVRSETASSTSHAPQRRFSASSLGVFASKVKEIRKRTTYGINPICEDRIVCLNKST